MSMKCNIGMLINEHGKSETQSDIVEELIQVESYEIVSIESTSP